MADGGRHGPSYNFSTVLRRHADRLAAHTALVDVASGRRYTWAEVDRRVDVLAALLRDDGVGQNDVVAILLYNCPEFIELIFAANRLGAIFLPLNWRLASEELFYILEHATARAVITEPAFYPALANVVQRLPNLRVHRSLDPDPPTPWLPLERSIEERGRPAQRVSDADVDADDLHRLMYTSGTTAHPKGVMLSYANLYWKNLAHVVEFGISSEDRTLVVGPLYHVGGLDLPATGTLHVGGSLVILPKFEARSVLETIAKERPTNVWLAPAMINLLLREPAIGNYDLTSIRFIIDGGEKMPLPLIRRLKEVFPNAWFADAYGLSETASGDTFLDKGRAIDKIGSVGKPVVHLELRVVDEAGRDAGANVRGEIVLRGPKVFKGYWRNDEATAAAIDSAGWFHTGDIGQLDEDGFLFIVDRKKDMIISGGENIASLEVERVLHEHPSVLECAVVGKPDPKWGEIPIAFVVLRSGHAVTADELKASCEHKLAKFKIPKAVLFVSELPRNPSGKVLKRVLRDETRAK